MSVNHSSTTTTNLSKENESMFWMDRESIEEMQRDWGKCKEWMREAQNLIKRLEDRVYWIEKQDCSEKKLEITNESVIEERKQLQSFSMKCNELETTLIDANLHFLSTVLQYNSLASPSIMVLDGNIGAGKSSLIDFVRSDPDLSLLIDAVPEPIEYWQDFLPLYYQNPSEMGLFLQNIVMSSHTLNSQRIIRSFFRNSLVSKRNFQCQQKIEEIQLNKKKMILFERNAKSCNLFSQCMNLREYEIKAIEKLTELLTNENIFVIPKIEKQIYLKADAKICDERIKKRDRKGESSIPLEYLEKLNRVHDEYLDSFSSDRKFIIDSTHLSSEQVHQIFKSYLLSNSQ